MKYEEVKNTYNAKVYVIQELPGTRMGTPKFNIMGASRYGEIITLLPENSQIIMSPGPLIFKLRKLLKNFTEKDYLLLSGDPKVIGLAIAIACDINNGKYKTLTWDRQEKMYYPIKVNLYEKGKIEE